MTEQHVIYSSYAVEPFTIYGEQRWNWYVPAGNVHANRWFRTEEEAHADARAAFGL